MKFLLFVLFLLPLGAQTPPLRVRDYKIPIPVSLIDKINDTWATINLDYRLTSQDVTYRLKDGRSSSIYGHITITCTEKTSSKMNFIFSTEHASTLAFTEKMSVQGLKPVSTLDSAFAFINSSEVVQQRLSTFVASTLIDTCGEKEELDESFMAFSLWLSQDENKFNFSVAKIAKSKFELLK